MYLMSVSDTDRAGRAHADERKHLNLLSQQRSLAQIPLDPTLGKVIETDIDKDKLCRST